MAGGAWKVSQYVVASPSLRAVPAGRRRRVLLSTRVGRPAVVSETTWLALTKQRHSDLPPEIVATLVEAGVLVPGEEDELAAVLAENLATIAGDPLLKHVIQPTAACQLGCDYCGQEHAAHHMPNDHQDALVRRLNRHLAMRTYEALEISWFGAEPLLGLKVMRRLSPRLIELAERHGVGYASTIVTNGLRLTPQIALELERIHRVRAAEVTLDGPESVHDARRHTKNGKPSFSRILANLVALSRTSSLRMELSVRCNVDRRNVDGVSELIDTLRAEGLQRRVALSFAPVYSWGNDADALALPLAEFGAREVEWFAQMHDRGYDLDLLPRRRPIVCLAVRSDGELTDAYGDVFTCTEVSYVPAYGRPNRFAIATLDDGDRHSGPQPFRRFNHEIAAGEHAQCSACPMLPACGGACPKQWSEGRVPCPSTKVNLPERLALWYATRQVALAA